MTDIYSQLISTELSNTQYVVLIETPMSSIPQGYYYKFSVWALGWSFILLVFDGLWVLYVVSGGGSLTMARCPVH